jgi:predicted ATPase
MERAAGFVLNDTPQVKVDKLDAMLTQTSTSKQDAALFAEMLSLPNKFSIPPQVGPQRGQTAHHMLMLGRALSVTGRYPVLNMDPQQRRQKTLEALTAQVEALSRQNPVLMIFEDVHWTDRTSLEMFGRAVDRVRSLPGLLIVTFRPEFDPPWIGRSYVTALTINRLAQYDIEAMIDGLVGNKLIPAGVRKDIIEHTDGIPLFVEEMTKSVLEAGSEEEAQQTAPNVPSTVLAVPASLHASLMARLDRLGPAKEVAQIGAAIGREFSHALMAAVTRKAEGELPSAWTVSFAPVCCSGRACRLTKPTFSSTPWYRTRLMGRCCGNHDARSMPGSQKPSKVSSPTSPRPNVRCWRATTPRQD